ncbi:alpha/beta hydrolase [Fodinisporobacter ferrooxydans]|uniref:Alpha/beta hydrolase n=1 Tax=Fodinisporobacter ferrooxydans TaxID=2901836 RepID=A0ABY4CS38_9BACL|nr:alpha/beta hydrolase [Alicyclobacillaceae bacterium MYW30-H2]
MSMRSFSFIDPDGFEIFVYTWLPEITSGCKAVVQIAHGMNETAERYERFAKALTANGYIVYANDHRGHGRSVKSAGDFGYIGEDGYTKMVENMHQLNRLIQSEHPSLPIVLFGHSMGSFLAQTYISRYGSTVQGVILSGTNGKQSPMLHLGIYLAKQEMKKNGDKWKSERIRKLVFDPYNKPFAPNRTDFDWLTRDQQEVDAYIQNPCCGNHFPASFFYYFFKGLRDIHKSENLKKIPKDLPIYLFSGAKDPVGNCGKGVLQLASAYRTLGLKHVQYKLYPGGRHEMLNEINRDEVTRDVLKWLDEYCA